jgi:hypothetical protein
MARYVIPILWNFRIPRRESNGTVGSKGKLQFSERLMAMCQCKRFGLTSALLLLLLGWAHTGFPASRADGQEHGGQGYVFLAPGAFVGGGSSVGTAHLGAGGEALIYRGIGAGAEIGYLTPWRDFSAGIGVLSLNGSYHFNRARKLSPFLTGGYSLAFRNGHANLFNVGGGMNYWFSDKVGLRLEFRDHINTGYTLAHYLSSRIGISFR